MNYYPELQIDLRKVEHNALLITKRCRERGIEVIGVTKGCLGHPEVAKAMVRGGVAGIGDSRLPNLSRLNRANLGVSLMMLRLPMLSEAAEVVTLTEVSLNSGLETIEVLSMEAEKQGRTHAVILMVETGDLREGVDPAEVPSLAKRVTELSHINLVGLGTNVACLEGVPPTPERLKILAELKDEIEAELEIKLITTSGGNSSAWKLIERGEIPSGINQVRFGEAILLGRETIDGDPISGAFQDAFTLYTEVIENVNRQRTVVALGKQDVDPEGLVPRNKGIKIVKASSDHLVLDTSGSDHFFKVGEIIAFDLRYQALLRAMTSPFVQAIIKT